MPRDIPQPDTDEIKALIAGVSDLEGPLLPILHALQDAYGVIPDIAQPLISEALNISRAEVHGVVSFYHDFRTLPAGRHVVKICRAEACQAMGGAALGEHAQARLGVEWHGTTENGAVTLEPVYCLGLCACGPSAMVDGKLLGRVDAQKLDRIIGEIEA